MATNEQINGAPYPLSINGVTYRARTLTDRDWDELNAWVRWKLLKDAKESIDKMNLIAEDRREMLTAATLASSAVTFNSVEGSRIVNSSSEGLARVGWQMVRHFHPKLRVEEFIKQVTDNEDTVLDNLREINEAFIYLNIGAPEEVEPEPGEGSGEDEKSNEETGV